VKTVGNDPGTKNSAIALIEDTRRGIRCVGSAMLFCPLSVIQGVDAAESALNFESTWQDIFDTFQPNAVAVERWAVRGRFNGAQSEIISFGSGIIRTLAQWRGIEFQTMLAATWKNSVKRAGVDLQDCYNWGKTVKTGRKSHPPHRIDASLIGLWQHTNGMKGVDSSLIWRIVEDSTKTLGGR